MAQQGADHHDRSGGQDAPDRTFGFLTRGQAARIRSMAQQRFAESRCEVVIEPDGLVAAGGRVWGLAGLMGECANWPAGEKDWPELVRQHVGRMVVLAEQPAVESLSRDEVLARVYLRLIRSNHIPATLRNDFSYARPLAPGFHRVLTIDCPESISLLTDEFVYPFGLGDLLDAGAANLRRVPFGRTTECTGDGDERIVVVTGGSVYTSSKVALMPEVVREVLKVEDHEHGVLVSVPTRHKFIVSLVRPASALATTRAMMQATVDAYHHSLGAISPLLYWWRDHAYAAVSVAQPDGSYLLDTHGPYAPVLAGFIAQGRLT